MFCLGGCGKYFRGNVVIICFFLFDLNLFWFLNVDLFIFVLKNIFKNVLYKFRENILCLKEKLIIYSVNN